LRLARDPHVR